MNQKGFVNIILIVIIVVVLGAVGYFSFLKKSPKVTEQTNTATQIRTSMKEWRDLTDQIRAMKPGPEKDALIMQYLKISDGSLSVVILDAIPEETDRVLFDHDILLLQRIINADGIHHLVYLINKTPKNSARHELFLKILRRISSPAAMPALREIVRNKQFTPENSPLVEATLALVYSGREDDVRAVFDRINLETKNRSLLEWIYSKPEKAEKPEGPSREDPKDQEIRQKLSSVGITAQSIFDITNPDALPFLLSVASGNDSKNTKAAQEVAIYNLVHFRNDPKTDLLLNDLMRSRDKDIADAASEALKSIK